MKMSKDFQKRLALVVMLCAAVTLLAAPVFAGVTGVEFQGIYDTVKGWTTGYLGKLFAVAIFLVGVAMGIMRQSLMAAATGIGAAIMVNYTPSIIESIATATI